MDVSDPFSTRGPRSNVFFFFKGSGHHRDLPSSPTRRSSDLHKLPNRRREMRRLSRWPRVSTEPPPTGRSGTPRPGRNREDTTERRRTGRWCRPPSRTSEERSEEHTSELQSQSNLVCRLLLEK